MKIISINIFLDLFYLILFIYLFQLFLVFIWILLRFTKNYSEIYVLQTLSDMITNQIHEKLILSFIERNKIEMAYHSNTTHVLKKYYVYQWKCLKKNLCIN